MMDVFTCTFSRLALYDFPFNTLTSKYSKYVHAVCVVCVLLHISEPAPLSHCNLAMSHQLGDSFQMCYCFNVVVMLSHIM